MSPLYDYYCENCKSVEEIKLSLSEHSEKKDKQICKNCNSSLIQKVSPLRFKLEGAGWFDQEYGITQSEIDGNTEKSKLIDDEAKQYIEKEKQQAKAG